MRARHFGDALGAAGDKGDARAAPAQFPQQREPEARGAAGQGGSDTVEIRVHGRAGYKFK
jgi:hypothetical protein